MARWRTADDKAAEPVIDALGELNVEELVAGGKSLEANQLDKIKGEEGVKEELAALQAKLQKAQAGAGLAKNSQDEGKWR